MDEAEICMKFSEIESLVSGLPATATEQGRAVYQFILDNKVSDIIEIGTAYGKSACYMAAALHELGRGSVTTLDVPEAASKVPNAETLAKRCGLEAFVSPRRARFGSHWLLREMIKDSTSAHGQTLPRFDLCFIDGYHSWEHAGLDFFLVDKLLKIGGWIIFDDLGWTFATSPSWSKKASEFPQDYREAPHVSDVYELLVRQHPSYGNFKSDNRWGWAQKLK